MRVKHLVATAGIVLGAVLTFQQCAKVKYVIPDDPASQAAAVQDIADEFCKDGETFPANGELGTGLCCMPKETPQATKIQPMIEQGILCAYSSCLAPRVLNENTLQCEMPPPPP